ncbi:shikimate/quinate 5-dehydrogenase [Fibrisoma limi BUZ 3]|uniref:Shikimate/quinate 5-dehydrogenase n=1 Tax=Fibrisoma limi BUZ 3 TaxID=1185876 RepID=I2GIG8_9BACT|nr:shikimate/quinate 5-dehydrogenase [Fibrisoma limi]CCH53693.1 shikimate/quinate 5-dehydrogenase [Fibrisoma limi BUZ 3]
MKKFAFLIHMRSSYQTDMRSLAKPLGLIPDAMYRLALRNRPLPPFVWSDVTLTPGATEPEGHIIMLPYTGRQILEQQKAMLPRIEQAVQLAASRGAELVGLGALTSPVTLGGKLLVKNSPVSVTNGNAFTAYITWQKVVQLLDNSPNPYPIVALVGATGSVGSLVCQLLATYQPTADYMLVARNERKLTTLAADMTAINPRVRPMVSQQMTDVRQADIVVLLTSAADALLQAEHLKPGAIVLDDTQPRNTHPSLLRQRPDVTVIDGGLVSMPYLKLDRYIGLPRQISYACLAETMLLAKAGYNGHFSIGHPTLGQAEYISRVARQFAHLGFGISRDFSFGKPLAATAAVRVTQEPDSVLIS